MPAEVEAEHWSGRFLAVLSSLGLQSASNRDTLDWHPERLLELRQAQARLERRLRRELREREPAHSIIDLLKSVSEIGFATAACLCVEFVDMKRFRDGDHLVLFVGLVPSVYSSGDRQRVLGLTRRYKKYLRSILIQASWRAVVSDPAPTQKYSESKRRMCPQKAIIWIARKLLNRNQPVVWLLQQAYQKAVLK